MPKLRSAFTVRRLQRPWHEKLLARVMASAAYQKELQGACKAVRLASHLCQVRLNEATQRFVSIAPLKDAQEVCCRGSSSSCRQPRLRRKKMLRQSPLPTMVRASKEPGSANQQLLRCKDDTVSYRAPVAGAQALVAWSLRDSFGMRDISMVAEEDSKDLRQAFIYSSLVSQHNSCCLQQLLKH